MWSFSSLEPSLLLVSGNKEGPRCPRDGPRDGVPRVLRFLGQRVGRLPLTKKPEDSGNEIA